MACACCRRTAAMRCMRSTRSAGSSTTSPTRPARWKRNASAWRHGATNIAALYQGRTEGPVTRVLAAAVARFQLRAEDFIAVIDGMQTDAETVIVAPDMAELDLYCDRVASAVGRLSVRAFGDASPAADRVAHALGRALQLTNILGTSRRMRNAGRIYLPLEYLLDAGVPADPVAILTAPGLPVRSVTGWRRSRMATSGRPATRWTSATRPR